MISLHCSPLGFLSCSVQSMQGLDPEEEGSERTTGSEGEGEQAFRRAWRTRPEQLWQPLSGLKVTTTLRGF